MSDKPKFSTNELASLRNSLAESRTVLAAERTFAAWTRTGFSVAGIGWTLGELLSQSEGYTFAVVIGGILIILGVMCIVYGWLGFKKVYDYINRMVDDQERESQDYPIRLNLITVSILSFTLIAVFIVAFVACF